MFRKVKYYDSADIMPIGRYMLATCRDLRYFAIGELPKKINKRRLKKAVKKLNKSILKDSNTKYKINKLDEIAGDEGKIYVHSCLVAAVAYANSLIDAGADKKMIEEKLKPIQSLLIERGLTADSKRNAARLEKIARNFVIKSNELKNRLKNANIENEKVYENYLRNLFIIERAFGVKIDENKDSINKYVLLIDEIKKHGNRSKQKS